MCQDRFEQDVGSINQDTGFAFHHNTRVVYMSSSFLLMAFVSHDLSKVHTVHTVKSAVSLKWQVGFENDMKITPIFTITFSSKMLIKQYFT